MAVRFFRGMMVMMGMLFLMPAFRWLARRLRRLCLLFFMLGMPDLAGLVYAPFVPYFEPFFHRSSLYNL